MQSVVFKFEREWEIEISKDDHISWRLHLLVQNKDVSVVACSEGREGLEVASYRLSRVDAVSRNVCHHPVQIFRVLLGQVAVGVRHD